MAKILVVEDDASLSTLLYHYLSEAGHEVVIASDGSEGTTLATSVKPDLVILDFNLPAANGAMVHERIRRNATNGVQIPVIFLTASPVSEIIVKVKDDSMTHFLQKPIDFPLLDKTIAAFIRKPAPLVAPPPPTAPPGGPDASDGDEILDLDA